MIEVLSKIRSGYIRLSATDISVRNRILDDIILNIEKYKDDILNENSRDIKEAEKNDIEKPILKRLELSESKLKDIINGLKGLIELDDPINRVISKTLLDEGLVLSKVTVPIGVIGVVFEARPDALIQIGALCIKSGNAAILKGGSEAKFTNKYLYNLIRNSIERVSPELIDIIYLIDSRDAVKELLSYDRFVDLIIPRGSNEFVGYIKNNTNIPVMGHADGICHIFVDRFADIEKALRVCNDAKTQYVAVCNAMETLLVDSSVAEKFLPAMKLIFDKSGVRLKGDKKTCQILQGIESADESDWSTEYLDYILSIKIVDGIEEAIEHINKYGSKHTDGIITEDINNKTMFKKLVDTSSVVINCSTRFADGYRYGFGAEVGISTSKIHARGPVGLDGLIIYKYELEGQGHIVSDYSGENAKGYIHRKLT